MKKEIQTHPRKSVPVFPTMKSTICHSQDAKCPSLLTRLMRIQKDEEGYLAEV
jgi:hypothetical protein